MTAARSYARVFAAYAIVVVVCVLVVATVDLSYFRPGGEFATPAGRFFFTAFFLGGSLLVLGVAPLALMLLPFMHSARTIRVPSLVGLLFALLVLLFVGVGSAESHARRLAIPAPIVAGGLAAALVLPLVLVLARRSQSSRRSGA